MKLRWSTVNDAFDNIAKPHEGTILDLFGALESAQLKASRVGEKVLGAGIVPATFHAGVHPAHPKKYKGVKRWRKLELTDRVYLLMLDVDGATCSVDEVLEPWKGLAIIHWSTYSHGVPGKGLRMRVLVPYARPVSDTEHRALYAWAVIRSHSAGVDESAVTTQTSDPTRIMFGPGNVSSESEAKPWLECLDGAPLNPERLPDCQSVAKLLVAHQKPKRASSRRRPDSRHELTPYVKTAVVAEVKRVLDAQVGGRHTALFNAACQLGELVAGGALAEHVMRAELEDAATAVGLELNRETYRQIERGLELGEKAPRRPAPPTWKSEEQPKMNGKMVIKELAKAVPDIPELEPPSDLKSKSHVALAKKVHVMLESGGDSPLRAAEGSLWRYRPARGVWQKLEEHHERQALHQLDGCMVEVGKKSDGKPRLKRLDLSSSAVSGVIRELRTLSRVAKPDLFVERPQGIQFADGFLVVDKSGTRLEVSSPRFKQRAALEFSWNQDAQRTNFNQALHDWFEPSTQALEDESEEELAKRTEQAYEDAWSKVCALQEFFGACLLGFATDYQRCLLLRGDGGDGKSTLLKIATAAFPSAAWAAVNPQQFADQYYVAMLAGKRINLAADIPARDILESATFKRVVTGDAVVGRHIRDSPFTFWPLAGHVFSANKLPGTTDLTDAFWRRFIIIEFPNQFIGREDVGLAAAIIREELPGVIAWMIEGAVRLLRNGHYTLPSSSIQAVEDWKHKADIVSLWLEERCVEPPILSKGATTRALFDDFKEWCRDANYRQRSLSTFRDRLKALLGSPTKVRGIIRYPVCLKPNPICLDGAFK